MMGTTSSRDILFVVVFWCTGGALTPPKEFGWGGCGFPLPLRGGTLRRFGSREKRPLFWKLGGRCVRVTSIMVETTDVEPSSRILLYSALNRKYIFSDCKGYSSWCILEGCPDAVVSAKEH